MCSCFGYVVVTHVVLGTTSFVVTMKASTYFKRSGGGGGSYVEMGRKQPFLGVSSLTNTPPCCRIVSLVVLWSLLFLLIYKVLTLETTYEEYDPFAILQVDPVSVNSNKWVRNWYALGVDSSSGLSIYLSPEKNSFALKWLLYSLF